MAIDIITNTPDPALVDIKSGEILLGEALMTTYADIKDEIESLQGQAGRMEMAIIREITANGGTALPSDEFICEMVSKNTYDQTRFVPIKEELNETEMGHCWVEAWVEQKPHEGKFDTSKLKGIVNKRGGKAKALFESAQMPGPLTLNFKRRELVATGEADG